MRTDDLPTLRQTLQVLEQQHAALDAEEHMLESEVRGVLALGWNRRVVEVPRTHQNPSTLPAQIKKKKMEVNRNEARLKSLQTVRYIFVCGEKGINRVIF